MTTPPKMRSTVDPSGFNQDAMLPYELRISDFQHAMDDVYDFFADVNQLLQTKGLKRLSAALIAERLAIRSSRSPSCVRVSRRSRSATSKASLSDATRLDFSSSAPAA